MKCKFCHIEQSVNNVFCIRCGEPFYRVTLPRQIIYDAKGTYVVPFILENHGAHPFAVAEVQSGGKNVISYSDKNWPQADPGQSKSFELSCSGEAAPGGTAELFFHVMVIGSKARIRPDSPALHFCAVPKVTVEGSSEVLVGPLRGYDITIRAKLVNESKCSIQKCHLFDGSRKVHGFELSEEKGCLQGQGATIDIPIRLPSIPDERATFGTRAFGLQLDLRYLDPVRFPLNVVYLDLPSLSVLKRHWTEKGFTFSEIPAGMPADWCVPAAQPIRKQLRLKANSAGKDKDEGVVEIVTLVEGDLSIEGITPGEKERIEEGPLTLVSDGIESDLEACLTFRVTDQRVQTAFQERRVTAKFKAVQQVPYPVFAALDFGTSSSCIVLIPAERRVGGWDVDYAKLESLRPLPVEVVGSQAYATAEFEGCFMPSIVLCRSDKVCEFGREAISSGYPARNLSEDRKNLKRDIYWPEPLPELGNRTTVEGASMVIGELVKRATEFLQEKGSEWSLLDKLIMSVPTRYTPAWRRLLKEACIKGMERIGISNPDVRLVEESRAVLRYYVETAKEEIAPGVLMIIDFGGGTTDVTAVRVVGATNASKVFQVLATGGNPKLGGLDVDEWIEQWAEEKGLSKKPDHYGWQEEIKFRIGSADLNLALSTLFGGQLPKNEVNRLAASLKQRVNQKLSSELELIFSDMIEQVCQAFAKAGVVERQKLNILLAGNGSRLFGMKDAVSSVCEKILRQAGYQQLVFSPQGVTLIREPKLCVSMGAFLEAGVASGRLSELTDVSTFSILMLLPGESKVSGDIQTVAVGGKRYAVLVRRGESLPCNRRIPWGVLGRVEAGACQSMKVPLYSQFGVEKPELVGNFTLTRTKDAQDELEVTVDDDGEVKIEWR